MIIPSARPPTPRFAIQAIALALLSGISPIQAAQPANPPPTPPVQLPPVEVTAQQQKKTQPIFETNPLFLHAFADLRSGPMIEAIFWRHRYLEGHPREQAVIVTTGRGNRILSATTVYTLAGRVYGSSNALGERFPIRGVAPADLGSAAGITGATKYLNDYRQILLDGARPLEISSAPRSESGRTPPDTTPEITIPVLGSLLVAAEETGNYVFPTQNVAKSFFPGPSADIVSWTYEALQNPDRAGIVPTALGQITGQGTAAAVPPFAAFGQTGPEQPQQFILQLRQFVAFDWDGVQYYYHPDIGTWAKPLPTNSVTGLPDLCVKHGELMECAYFCATYMRQHPGKKAALVAGDPVAAAFEADEKLGLFIPTLGGFTLGKQYLAALADRNYLGQIRDQVVAAKLRQKSPADAIPDNMPGDDSDMQMRRAFLALRAAGIACQLHEEKQPSLEFSWEGVNYVYNSDRIRASAATPEPGSYQVLAESRYAESIAQPAGDNGRISAQQAAAVLEPLKAALRLSPSLNLYNLMVATWGRCDAKVPSGDIDTLLAGTALFPRSIDLSFKVALVCARNGYRAQAIELVHRELAVATEPADQGHLEQLRSILEKSPAAGAK